MAILTKFKEKVASGLMTTADKGANLIAQSSGLSSGQLERVEARRNKYLSEKPDTAPEGIKRLLGSYAIEAFAAYLPQLSTLYEPIDLGECNDSSSINSRIRYFEITRWVSDPNEDNIDKLINVYHVVSDEMCNVALIYCRKMDGCKVYLAVCNTAETEDPATANSLKNRLKSALKGNFPGAEVIEETGSGMIPELQKLENVSIASVSNIAADKSEDFMNQSIEKLLDGVCPEEEDDEYVVVLLATPVREQLERRNALSELYSKLAPYSNWQTNFNYSDTMSEGSSANFGLTLGASAGAQFGRTESQGDSYSKSNAEMEGSSHTDSSSTGTTDTTGKSSTTGVSGGFKAVKGHHDRSKSESHSTAETNGTSDAVNKAKTVTDTIGKVINAGTNSGGSFGVNFGTQFSRSSNVTAIIGKSEGITQNYVNYGIKYTLELIEKQIKRLEESSALGMWDFSAYVMSANQTVANNAAHMYLALTQGEDSYMSQSAVNLWVPGGDEQQIDNILKFIKRLQHPQFQLNVKNTDDDEWLMYPPHVSPTVSLTGREMARAMNFPAKSVSGLPVLESISFGREVQKFSHAENVKKSACIELGNIYHMHCEEKKTVTFDIQSLASHTFVTGSTGTGKSNTIYQMLEKLRAKKVNFLVIEPAKGEYKDVFGKDADVSVYGTNPKISPLLRINPFSFPDKIHILEHLDRLVEIFNVCWPMYAAMPAVLKSAIEKAYVDCGWDLLTSTNLHDDHLYPQFADVAKNIKTIIDSSEYDTDNKGAYKGSLLTRLQSLTNGINGMIFSSNELSGEELFNRNVIVDLSRVGSSETKSLIMGMLVLKLQEFRMSETTGMNAGMRHVTVLEEAHNLLRKIPAGASSEGSNILAKSVEMLANAIAEMRTYGEGFIIADQAPGLMDMSVIRNTNTKIILRLPDQSDRELVGLAANLNEDQIHELAKLPCGVAAVYQNEWVQPVLCKVDYYDTGSEKYMFDESSQTQVSDDRFMKGEVAAYLIAPDSQKKSFSDLKKLKKWIIESNLASSLKMELLSTLDSDKEVKKNTIEKLVSELVDGEKKVFEKAMDSENVEEWNALLIENLDISTNHLSGECVANILECLIHYRSLENACDGQNYLKWMNYMGRRVM